MKGNVTNANKTVGLNEPITVPFPLHFQKRAKELFFSLKFSRFERLLFVSISSSFSSFSRLIDAITFSSCLMRLLWKRAR